MSKALELTGNTPEEHHDNARFLPSKWRPAGKIEVWDDEFDEWSGVYGIEVRARRWFVTYKGTTNSNGSYSCDGKFRYDAHYSIKWERHQYSIRAGRLFQAKMDGPQKKGDWNVQIPDDDIQQFYAFLHIAAYEYYYGDILDLKRPPENDLLHPQMKIAGMDDYYPGVLGSYNHHHRYLGILTPIKMYRKRINDDGVVSIRDSRGLYATMIHELAHASHWELRKGKWDHGTSRKLKESWAEGVEWALTKLRYPNYIGISLNSFEDMRTSLDGAYTSLVIDLVDDLNQASFFGNATEYPLDLVTGYTMAQIEAVLGDCDNIFDLKQLLEDRYENPYEGENAPLTWLFDQYSTLTPLNP